MKNNKKPLGSIIPFPNIVAPKISNKDLKNESDIVSTTVSFMKRIQAIGYYMDWLIPQLAFNNIYAKKLDSFVWDAFRNQLLKIKNEVEPLDIYDLTKDGLFGVASEGIFALKFAFLWKESYGHYGFPGLIRDITDIQSEIIKLLFFSGIFDYIFAIYLFDFEINPQKIAPLIHQSQWLFEKLGMGYIAYQMPKPSKTPQDLKTLVEVEPSKLEKLINYSTDGIRKQIKKVCLYER